MYLASPCSKARPDLRDSAGPIHLEVYRSGKRFVAKEVLFEISDSEKTETKYFDAIIDPLFDENGKIIGQLATSIEVTDQVMARKKIEESDEISRLFIEYAPAAMAMFDKEMRYVSVSKKWMKEYDLSGNVVGQKTL
jgi:PAS domain-containing protein